MWFNTDDLLNNLQQNANNRAAFAGQPTTTGAGVARGLVDASKILGDYAAERKDQKQQLDLFNYNKKKDEAEQQHKLSLFNTQQAQNEWDKKFRESQAAKAQANADRDYELKVQAAVAGGNTKPVSLQHITTQPRRDENGVLVVDEGYFNPQTGERVITGTRAIADKEKDTQTAAQKQAQADAKRIYTDLLALEKMYKPEYVGFLDSKLPAITRGKEELEFRAANARLLSQIVQLVSGAAASDREREFIKRWSPNEGMNQKQYVAALEQIKHYMEAKMRTPADLEEFLNAQLEESQQAADADQGIDDIMAGLDNGLYYDGN